MQSLENCIDPDRRISVAVDFGGTKIAAARICGGLVQDRRQVSTDSHGSPQDHVRTIAGLAESLGAREAHAVGVAVCGRVDREGNWHAVNLATLKALTSFPLRPFLEDYFQRPVQVMNDCVAAAWGEYNYSFKNDTVESLLFVAVSTGIGAGIVLNGRPLVSRSGLAGHIGFMSSPFAKERCGSGRWGTLESIASGTAIGSIAASAAARRLTAQNVFAAHLAQDENATVVVETSAKAVADAIVSVRTLLDVEVAVLGGGVGLVEDYVARVRAHVAREPPLFRLNVRRAKLDANSALHGVVLPFP